MFLLYMVPLALFAAALAAYLLFKADKHDRCVLCAVVGFISMVLVIMAGIGYSVMAWSWLGAQYQASIINREYGTNYSREEIFFASSSIETIQHLNRKRFQVDGDLMRDAPDKK